MPKTTYNRSKLNYQEREERRLRLRGQPGMPPPLPPLPELSYLIQHPESQLPSSTCSDPIPLTTHTHRKTEWSSASPHRPQDRFQFSGAEPLHFGSQRLDMGEVLTSTTPSVGPITLRHPIIRKDALWHLLTRNVGRAGGGVTRFAAIPTFRVQQTFRPYATVCQAI